MCRYQRVNLAFLKDDETEKRVYALINTHRNKTEYVKQAILFYEENRLEISKDNLSQVLIDILGNGDFITRGTVKNTDEDDVLDAALDSIELL